MKKALFYLLTVLAVISVCVSCNPGIDDKVFDKSVHEYELQDDGSWRCKRDLCYEKYLAGTQQPYIALIVDGEVDEDSIVSLVSKFDGTKGVGTGTVSFTGEKVTYDNTNGTAQKVVIRTNGENIVVYGKKGNSASDSDEIIHYGYAKKITVNVGDYCFYTHAYVEEMTISEGKAVADENGYVALVSASENATVEEQNGGIFVIPENTSSAEIPSSMYTSLGYKESESKIVLDSSTKKTTIENYGVVTISNENELIAFRDDYNSGKYCGFKTLKIVLDSDITLTEKWVPIGTWEYPFHGTFEGGYTGSDGTTKCHTITGLQAADPTTVSAYGNTTGPGEVFGFFGIVGDTDGNPEGTNEYDVSISNVTFESVNIQGYEEGSDGNIKNVGVVIGYAPTTADFQDIDGKGGQYAGNKWSESTDVGYTSIKIDNVSVSGTMDVQAHAGGIIGKLYEESTATLTNCTSDMSITTHDNGGLAGFIGYCRGSEATLSDCLFTSNSKLIYAGNGTSVQMGDYCAGDKNCSLHITVTSSNPNISISFMYESIKNLTTHFTKGLKISNLTFESIDNYGEVELTGCISGDSKYSDNRGKMTINGDCYFGKGLIVYANSDTTINSGKFKSVLKSSTIGELDSFTICINGGYFESNTKFIRGSIKEGWTLSSDKNTDGYYYLVEKTT